ncbi:MAG: YceI family protein [Pseudomonadota bacterium]
MSAQTDSAYARYTRVAILLHWAIAALILFQLLIGYLMVDAIEAADADWKRWGFEQIQLHKSVGLTVLGLSVLRLAWRILHPAPALPAGMSRVERIGSALSHWGFYALMIGLPLSGWAMSSASLEFGSLKTFYFGLFAVPHLPGLDGLAPEARAAVANATEFAHHKLAVVALALVVLHVAAALKHHLVDRDAVLARMVPGLSPRDGRALERPLSDWSGARMLGAFALLLLFGGATAALYVAEERKAVVEASAPATPLDTAADAGEAGAPAPETPGVWRVIHAESEIAFRGENSGSPFEGSFKTWTAEITFDPGALDASRVRVEIDAGSARTGDAQIDATLPEKDWLDAAAHPTAVFEADRFRRGDGEGRYIAEGALTLRGRTEPFELPFELSIDGDRARMTASATIDRLAFGIGEAADASGAWVSREIPLAVSVTAERGAPLSGASGSNAPDATPSWSVVTADSRIAFEGTNSGAPFAGAFKTWSADIRFDPARPETGSVRVEIDAGSARTGDAQIDATLPEKDWFDVANHPRAVFEAGEFRSSDGSDAYVADGALTLRGVTKPVELPFTLSVEGDQARMTAEIVLNRLDFGVGEAADGSGGFVGLEVPVRIELTATRTD